MTRKPTQEELAGMLDKGLGSLLKPDEVEKKKKSGDLPENFKVEDGFGVYKIEMDGNEYLCVTNVLCDKCVRVNGKVKRCEQHKKKKKPRKKASKHEAKSGDIQDDTSDREKVPGLRHIEDDDDEEDKIEGAFTPDAVLTPGIGGAIIMVPVDAKNNDKAGPPAKNMNHVKGILVRGAGYIPQYIPNDRLTKAHRLRFDNYIEGELVLQDGKEVFVPNTLGAAKIDDKTKAVVVANSTVVDKQDQKTVDQIGKDMVVPVQVEVADNGMPVMKVLDEKPKDKETAVGILIKKDDQVEFVQIAGKELGGGKDAKMMPCSIPENAKQGDAVADIYVNSDGKQVAAKPGEAPKDAQITGQVVVGKNDQLVFVPKGENKEEVIKKQIILTPALKEKLEKEEVKMQAAVTGQSQDHIETQVNKIGMEAAAANLKKQEAAAAKEQGPYQYGAGGEVKSVGFGANQAGGSVFATSSPQPGNKGGAAGGGGGGNNQNQGGYQYGAGGEVKSVGFGANQAGGSVFATAGPAGGRGGQQAKSGGGGGAGGVSPAAAREQKSYGGGGGKGGGGGGKSVISPAGGQNEVRSVGFGAQQHGGSVFATKGGGGGGAAGGGKSGYGGGGGGGGGGGKSVSSPASQNEVRSVGFGAQQYGGSVFVTNKAGGGGAAAAAAKSKPATKSPSYSSNEPKSVGFGVNQFGASVYARK